MAGRPLRCARGVVNSGPLCCLGPAQARDYETRERCVAALRVAGTGIIDYAAVCRALAADLVASGAKLRPSAEVFGV
jgi:(S)-2-hydroxyglutarate dehydrogenase